MNILKLVSWQAHITPVTFKTKRKHHFPQFLRDGHISFQSSEKHVALVLVAGSLVVTTFRGQTNAL